MIIYIWWKIKETYSSFEKRNYHTIFTRLYDIFLTFQIALFANYVHINSDAILED